MKSLKPVPEIVEDDLVEDLVEVEDFAINPVSGVVHQWHCGLGPARSEGAFVHLYVPVPAVALRSFHPDFLCTRCLPQETP